MPSAGEDATDAETGADAPRRTRKAPSAFRTISEVADELHIPQHVLRFWETKFPQVKPLKRGGGRRYYRPEDVALLRRVADLLYTQGYTIKGVQKLLREGTLKASGGPRATATAAMGRPVPRSGSPDALHKALVELRQELVALRALLAKPRR